MHDDRAQNGPALVSSSGSRNSSDPRVRRTRRALQDAMAALVEEGASITMSAVAQRAGFSRQVLHNHYDSVEQLAAEVLVRRILEGTGHEAPPEPDVAVFSLVDAVRQDGLVPFLWFIQDDRDAFLALRALAHGPSTAVLSRVLAGLAEDIGQGSKNGEAALFAAGGMTTLVNAWLHMEDPPTPPEQASLLHRFVRAVFAADGQSDRNGPER